MVSYRSRLGADCKGRGRDGIGMGHKLMWSMSEVDGGNVFFSVINEFSSIFF